ncbi:metal-dependent hydrolase [Cohnella zeiphila]|uniref:Permease n=1 Tax=Cohnella zeiphila TaxID=2761120 RepID=A0A7X0VU81_9BACL|nr:permease [Cohnella zeiphila]MBB6729997.1 permease [Cohnella zeiphila]
MFAGHFGLAAAVKAKTPKVPLWALMLSTQLLDVIFVPLLLTGKETMEGKSGYGQGLIHADYTHSLAGALIIALAAGLLAGKRWGKKGGFVIGATVMSHWVLDLFVHRPDMPLLPGNLGDLPLMGFGLWRWPWLTAAAELALVAIGAVWYARSLPRKAASGSGFRIWGAVTMATLLVLALATDTLGI